MARRAMAAVHRQADHQSSLLPPDAPPEGRVFATVDGAPLRPQHSGGDPQHQVATHWPVSRWSH
ncbi:hypothetical protein CP971_30160 [Streptomyces viridifaciens]|nr:hypothetical protein CP971_30160 [Streptomyces viridifaciens]